MTRRHDVDLGQHPLSEIACELDAFDERLRFGTETPKGAGWITLDELHERQLVGWLLDQSPASGMRLRNVAAAQLGASLACSVVRPLMALLHMYSCAPVIHPKSAYLLREGYRFHGLSIEPGELLVLGDAGPLGSSSVEHQVSSMDALVEHTAHSIVRLLAPVLQGLRTEGKFGLNQLWGSVLDMIGATSLLVARLGGLDQQLVWARAKQLCELITAEIEAPKVRQPKPFAVPWRGADALFTVKGTCCLQYREFGLRAGEDVEAGGYCKTCPFITDESRARLCASQLERDHPRIDGQR